MDISDQAPRREEQERAIALSRRKPGGPSPCGCCHNCQEPLPDGERWCDTDGRDDWEAQQR